MTGCEQALAAGHVDMPDETISLEHNRPRSSSRRTLRCGRNLPSHSPEGRCRDVKYEERARSLTYRPELPNPPGPREAEGSSSVTLNETVVTGTTTSWATRSPFFTW